GNVTIDATGCTGTAGTCKIGDTIVYEWDNSASGDNNPDITLTSQVSFDLSLFGLSSAATPDTLVAGVFSYTYNVVAGSIDANNLTFDATVTDPVNNVTGPVTSSNDANLDNIAPVVTDGNISVSGASGTGGAFIIGDTVVVTWNNSTGGDNNTDLATAIADLSDWGGGASVAMTDTTACGGVNGDNIYEACYTLVTGVIDTTSAQTSMNATDDAGNTTLTNDGQTYTVDTNPPDLTAWTLDLVAGTLTLVFDESVESSVLDVTAITLQDAATATTSYTLTDSTSASGDGTTIVITLSATDLAALEIDDGLATSITNTYLTIGSGTEDDLRGNNNTPLADGFGQQVFTYTGDPKFEQSAYRLFNNTDSTDVGSALAAQDTAATLAGNGDAFRLRSLVHVKKSDLAISGQNFKLQFATKSGTCDTGFVGETYADVTAGTAIAYHNNATPSDGDNLTPNANDPVHGGDTTVDQDYEELNNFTNSVAIIPAKDDGLWDFSLIDNNGIPVTSYCLRVVEADGTLLETYSVIPEITTVTGNTPPTGTWNSTTQKTNGSGYVDLSIEVNDAEGDDTKAKLEYETDSDGACNGPWAKATLLGPSTADFSDSGGVPDVTNANAYQVGSGATTRIITSSGSNTVQFDWDSKTDLPTANGTQCLRLTVNDDTIDQTTPAAQTVNVDNVNPTLSSWSLNVSTQTLTLVFDESVLASALDVTAITLQDAATAGTSYTLTDSTTASGNGITIVINLSTADYNAIQANNSLATSINDSYLTITASAEDDLVGNPNNAIANGSGLQAAAYTAQSLYTQSAYRLFNNADSADVGSALAAQDTAVSLASQGDAFRLRELVHVGGSALPGSGQNFKLQYALQSGSCDTGFVGESYSDVNAGTAIAFNNNPTPSDGANLTANANDPVHAGHTTNNQTYEELNNFSNSVSAIQPGRDGQWDFSLIDNDGNTGRTYCFRVVKADGSPLDTYSVIPQITTYHTTTTGGGGGGTVIDTPYNLAADFNEGSCASSRQVQLHLTASSANQVLIGNQANLDLETWQTFAGPEMTLPWTLTAGDGLKTVYVRFKSPLNNLSNIISASINLDAANQCGQPPVEPEEPEEPGEPAGPEQTACLFDCARAGYRLYIVNPDGTKRFINTSFVQEEPIAPGIITYHFEDKGEDFDYNDVVIKVNRSQCDRILVVPLEVNAAWKHEVRMEILYGGIVKKDLLLWSDSHDGLHRQSLIDLNKYPDICEIESVIEPIQRGFITVYEHINYQGRSESFYVGDNAVDLSDNKILSNVISSIRIFGAVVRFFDRIFFGGAFTLFTQDDPDLRDNRLGQDFADSLKVYEDVGEALDDLPPLNDLPIDRTPPPAPTPAPESPGPEASEPVSQAPACSLNIAFTGFLSLESQSDEVRRLQELLKCLGFFPVDQASTAIFGPVTEQAVKDFQTDQGLEPAGYVGPGTRAALNKYFRP
ncbi:peptidoglycan-binding protein, partial [Patescibacteria group bacterium]|nr:peptidoglycan-binding protein [Patescibacteria group bacterium]